MLDLNDLRLVQALDACGSLAAAARELDLTPPALSMRLKRLEQRLGVGLVVRGARGTAFTVSIEAREGVTTGISAADRARTILAAVAPDARPSDLVSPGHIFPLLAKPGGTLERDGHTEASVDHRRQPGLMQADVNGEITNEDGARSRIEDLRA